SSQNDDSCPHKGVSPNWRKRPGFMRLASTPTTVWVKMRRSNQKLNAVAGALSNRLVGQSPTRSYLFFRHPNQTPADIFNKSSFVSCWDIMKRALRKKV